MHIDIAGYELTAAMHYLRAVRGRQRAQRQGPRVARLHPRLRHFESVESTLERALYTAQPCSLQFNAMSALLHRCQTKTSDTLAVTNPAANP